MAKKKNADIEIIATEGDEPITKCDRLVPASQIEKMIFTFRGEQVMVDRDLAMLYGVETRVMNQSVKRNVERFPERFRFQLTEEETNELVTNCDRLHSLKHSSFQPFVFTEQGVAMLSTVLRSDTAVSVSIQIMDAFVAMRHFLASNAQVFQRLEVIEHHQLEMSAHLTQNDHQIEEIFKRLDQESITPTQGIFFNGQVFDAYRFACDLVRSAKKRIVLLDNYIDDTVLTLIDKRKKNVDAEIYTKTISQQLSLDIAKHNAQYRPITVTIFDKTHDRFLCIDSTVYHIGASLKDLGKKWFAFSKLEMPAEELLNKIIVVN